MKALLVTVAGVLLGLVASIANVTWLMVLAAFVALFGAYAQYRDGCPFVLVFSESSWQGGDSEYTLVIPRTSHKKSSPTVTVFEGKEPHFQEVGVAISVQAKGSVAVGASTPFAGKVTIK